MNAVWFIAVHLYGARLWRYNLDESGQEHLDFFKDFEFPSLLDPCAVSELSAFLEDERVREQYDSIIIAGDKPVLAELWKTIGHLTNASIIGIIHRDLHRAILEEVFHELHVVIEEVGAA